MTFPAKSIFQVEVDCYTKGIPFEITNQVAYAFTPLSTEIGYYRKFSSRCLQKSEEVNSAD